MEDGQSGRKNIEKRKERGRREKQKVGWMPSLLSATPWGRKANEKGMGSEAGKSSLRFEPGADRPTVRPTAI